MATTVNELTEVAVNHAFVAASFLLIVLRNAPHPLHCICMCSSLWVNKILRVINRFMSVTVSRQIGQTVVWWKAVSDDAADWQDGLFNILVQCLLGAVIDALVSRQTPPSIHCCTGMRPRLYLRQTHIDSPTSAVVPGPQGLRRITLAHTSRRKWFQSTVVWLLMPSSSCQQQPQLLS